MKKAGISRRKFLGTTAAVGAAGIIAPSMIAGCTREALKKVPVVSWLDQAPDGPVLKAGVIGCGGRGTGAAINFLNAGPNLQITALGDTFKDRVEKCRADILKEKGQEVPEDNCFVGFDAFQKVIGSDVDIIILATPPFFRPEHLAAAVAARKNIFAEKPVCVDPVGARSVMATALKAKELELSIVTGTQRRHQRDYVDAYNQVQAGIIGNITGGNVYWNGGKLWHRDNDPKWSEMEWMIRNWVNWTWLSGDHIVEQHVHNLDVMNWFMGSHPVKAVGMGSRLRRVTGDQYDNFSVDFVFDSGIHFHSMCRQINGCANNVSERIQGADGAAYLFQSQDNYLLNLAGEEIWRYNYPVDEEGKPSKAKMMDPYVQEHIDLVTAIRTGTPLNELENTAVSTLCAIMGRISAYTGKETTWDEMLNSDLKLGPKVFEFGPVDIPKDVPIAGEAYVPQTK
ncbi:MAG TPA: Gfo/Idh/MocA family oxidoreductase [Bacteroidales bacterium]|jgi:predicted dehydrogenase|nr:Gfo/Idh/MocA family oxidoreductase [Bacteroidales bacterium]OQB60610.1 MAG: Inositol 2-dehydrogenase/D-chiro-inositol 3-dehydrogenase [Bacteroidetes bacterium ADurb.Bin145]NMD01768.1 Gfo/Idh/MocA family oxidoreductase [Bacteroidales bacterium]HOU02467.1 Gfo/Idh/MocA family oxidoreductase [Bacteroidales bacterium]HQG62992.1 Gfo/Idh/MocA family oxidoreductase [Bacteroidales bacterium]